MATALLFIKISLKIGSTLNLTVTLESIIFRFELGFHLNEIILRRNWWKLSLGVPCRLLNGMKRE